MFANLFGARRREAAAERERDRAHMLAVMDTFNRSLEATVVALSAQQKDNTDALVEIARAQCAQAAVIGDWLKSFTTAAAPQTSVVTEEDEYAAEQARQATRLGIPVEALDDVPEEFKLALALRGDFRSAVAGDTSV